MFMLVSLARVKQALKVTDDDDDDVLTAYIGAASKAVVTYLKGQASEFIAIDSPPDSPPNDLEAVDPRIIASVIIIVGYIYREPDGDEASSFTQGNLPWKATALLYPMRDPTLA